MGGISVMARKPNTTAEQICGEIISKFDGSLHLVPVKDYLKQHCCANASL